jgi:hypothetical protein
VVQQAHQELYYMNRHVSIARPEEVSIVIHDKMDNSKIASSHFSHNNKSIDFFMRLLLLVIGMGTYVHGDI